MENASDQTPSTSTFQGVREIEVTSVVDLNRLRDISTRIGLDSALVNLIDNALERNRERKFSIAVVGEFKRGKSTFINALLGKEILPSDVLPTTATLNRVNYAFEPSVTLIRHGADGGADTIEQIGFDQLGDYVTKLTPEAEKIAATIKEAIVYYPLAYCKDNVEIIDTPGLNDNAAMTQVTLSVLPDVSAAILVIMATAPFGQSEADFLTDQLLLQDLGRVIFVVTAIDLLRNPSDRKRIVDTITSRISSAVDKRLIDQFGSADSADFEFYRRQFGPPRVFGLSGYTALQAKQGDNDQLLAESGFPEFEKSLEKFITETRGAVELQVLANRIIASSDEILKKLAMASGALEMQQEEFDQAFATSMTDLDSLRQRRDQELRQIDEASQRSKVRAMPLVEQMDASIRQSVEQTIAEAEIKPADLKKPSFQKELDAKVSAAIQSAAKRAGERIQVEIERDLGEEMRRLGGFAAEVSQVLHDIEMKFSPSGEQRRKPKGEAVALIIGGLVNSFAGGILAGYQEAGGKGAALGGAVSLSTFVAGSVLLAAIGVSGGLVLPAVIALGVGSTMLGRNAARAAFAQDQVDRFKREYSAAVLQELDKQLHSRHLGAEVNQQIDSAYKVLKDRIIGELDASINQTQNTLEQLRGQKARKELAMDIQRKDHEALRSEVQIIRDRAQTLTNYLVKINSV